MASALDRALSALKLLRGQVTRWGAPPGGTHQVSALLDEAERAVQELGNCHGLHNMGPDFRCTRCGKDSLGGEKHREMTTLESQEAIVRRRTKPGGTDPRDKKRRRR